MLQHSHDDAGAIITRDFSRHVPEGAALEANIIKPRRGQRGWSQGRPDDFADVVSSLNSGSIWWCHMAIPSGRAAGEVSRALRAARLSAAHVTLEREGVGKNERITTSHSRNPLS